MINPKKISKIFLCAPPLLLFSNAIAGDPIISISTATNSVQVIPGNTSTLTFLVRNNTGIPFSNMKYLLPDNTSVDGTTTCTSSLAAGATCNEVLTFTAPTNGTGGLELTLSACAFNGTVCASASSINRVSVDVTNNPVTPTVGTSVYVANTNDATATPINPTNDTAGTAITVGANPNIMAFTPDNSTLYVTSLSSNNVTAITTADNSTAAINVGENTVGVAITPDGTRAYVTSNSATNFEVYRINTADNTFSTISAGLASQISTPILILPDGSRAYTGELTANRGKFIEIPADTVNAANLALGARPQSLTNIASTHVFYGLQGTNVARVTVADDTVTTVNVGGSNRVVALPDGSAVYASISPNDQVVPITDPTGTPTAGAAIAVGDQPENLAASPDSSRVYVANQNTNTISVINTATNTVVATVTVGNQPFDVAVNSAGTRVYTANQLDDTVSVIDTSDNSVRATVTVGDSPRNLATPN